MAIARVAGQKATIRGSSVTSANGVYPGNVASGNLLVTVGAFWNTSSTLTTANTDTRSTTYSHYLSPGETWAGGFGKNFINYGLAPSSGACTVTVTCSAGSCYINGAVDEFSGVESPVTAVDGSYANGANTTPTNGITTTSDGMLIVGSMLTVAAVGITPGSGYTEIDEDETGARQPYGAEFKVAGTAGSDTTDWTLAASQAWMTYVAAFKAFTGAPAAGAPKLVGDRFSLAGAGGGLAGRRG